MIVMTGANGRLGKAIAAKIADLGEPGGYRFVTRDPASEHSLALADRGFEVVGADFGEVASVRRAFAGAGTILLISATGPASTRIPLHRNAIAAAVEVGADRIVYTSRVAPRATSPYPFAAIHDDSERQIVESGLDYVFLRNNEFAENLDPWILEALETGRFVFGAAGPIAFIERADVVDAAINALSWHEGAGAVFELSGPEAIDRQGIAGLLSAATGRVVRAAEGDSDEFARALEEKGRPEFVVEMGRGLFAASAAGEWSTTSTDPERLTGHPARPISAYIRGKFGSPPAG